MLSTSSAGVNLTVLGSTSSSSVAPAWERSARTIFSALIGLAERPAGWAGALARCWSAKSAKRKQDYSTNKRARVPGRLSFIDEQKKHPKRVEKSRTAQRMGKTAAEVAKARAETGALKGQLTTLQNGGRSRPAEFPRRLEEERERLHEARFLKTEVIHCSR